MAYVYQEFPKWKYHYQHKQVIVKDEFEEANLGPDWYNSPADVKPPEPVQESSEVFEEEPRHKKRGKKEDFSELEGF